MNIYLFVVGVRLVRQLIPSIARSSSPPHSGGEDDVAIYLHV
jgi:hypothetical protein